MTPLAWGKRSRLQARREVPTEHQEAENGSDDVAADLIQVLLISTQPLLCLRRRGCLDALWQMLFLAPELEQMGQPFGIFGESAGRRSWQSVDVAFDEGLIDICHGVRLLG
jgi:hypothetical protein